MDRSLKNYQLLQYHDGLLQQEHEEGNPTGQLESDNYFRHSFFRQNVLSLLSEDIDFELCMIYRLA